MVGVDNPDPSGEKPGFALFPPTPSAELADPLEIPNRVSRIGNGAVIPVHVRDRLNAERPVVGVLINLVIDDSVQHQVVGDLLLAPRCMNYDLPTFFAQGLQNSADVLARRAQHAESLPAVIVGDYAVEVDGDGSPRIVRFAGHFEPLSILSRKAAAAFFPEPEAGGAR